jgi:hypothetical protein
LTLLSGGPKFFAKAEGKKSNAIVNASEGSTACCREQDGIAWNASGAHHTGDACVHFDNTDTPVDELEAVVEEQPSNDAEAQPLPTPEAAHDVNSAYQQAYKHMLECEKRCMDLQAEANRLAIHLQDDHDLQRSQVTAATGVQEEATAAPKLTSKSVMAKMPEREFEEETTATWSWRIEDTDTESEGPSTGNTVLMRHIEQIHWLLHSELMEVDVDCDLDSVAGDFEQMPASCQQNFLLQNFSC